MRRLRFVPRPPRLQLPRALYHVTARGNRRQEIFGDDRDHHRFLALLADVISGRAWRCHAYCLLRNHYHLVIETAEPNISNGMQALNGWYAQWFNWRHQLEGHLFQGRFHAVVVESTAQMLVLTRYVLLNPVRAGLCARPADWRWSSYRATAGIVTPPPFLATERLLAHFGDELVKARRTFARYVEDAADSLAA